MTGDVYCVLLPVSSDAAFTFDAANDRMTITGTVVGTGPNNGWLNLNAGALTGAAEAMRASATMSDDLIVAIENARNLSNTGNATFQAKVGGANAADPRVQFIVNGVVTHAIGIDNSDSDKFKITPNATTPGGTANSGLIVTNEAPPKVGINKDVPTQAKVKGLLLWFCENQNGGCCALASSGNNPKIRTKLLFTINSMLNRPFRCQSLSQFCFERRRRQRQNQHLQKRA